MTVDGLYQLTFDRRLDMVISLTKEVPLKCWENMLLYSITKRQWLEAVQFFCALKGPLRFLGYDGPIGNRSDPSDADSNQGIYLGLPPLHIQLEGYVLTMTYII